MSVSLSTTQIVLIALGAFVLFIFVVLGTALLCRRCAASRRRQRMRILQYRNRDELAVNYINGNIGLDSMNDSTEDIMSVDNDNYLMSLETMMYTNPYISSSHNNRHSRF